MNRYESQYALKECPRICKTAQALTEILMDGVPEYVETNSLSLHSFLPHFQPDPLLFPLSLPFSTSSSPVTECTWISAKLSLGFCHLWFAI